MSLSRFFCVGAGFTLAACTQAALFDLESIPIHTPFPADQVSEGIRAHFSGEYSIQDLTQVILMMPTGFSGHSISPNSVFRADLSVSFFVDGTANPALVDSASILVAPQELACDSSATMRITAYRGTIQVGTATAIAPQLDTYMWPTIDLSITPGQLFDNVVVHWEKAPPTGGDYGVIFVADNLQVHAVPEPQAMLGLGLAGCAALIRWRKR